MGYTRYNQGLKYSQTSIQRPSLGPETVAFVDRWSFFIGSLMLQKVKMGLQNGGGHCRQVVASRRWPSAQV